MRRWLLIAGTLLGLLAAFAVFVWVQKDVGVTVQVSRPTPATRAAGPATQLGSIGRTEGGWVITRDKNTGLPQSRFRGSQFTPQQGDQVLVADPQAEFFLGHLRQEVVRVRGKSGLVTIPGEGPRIRSDLSTTPVQSPTRGEMRDVTVEYFRTQQDAANAVPEITLKLNNAYFDSEVYEIATESYIDEQGKKVDAKDVPVVVRGESFEFDGKGLRIRWDDQTQRLKSLIVYTGEQLVIKKPLDRFGPSAQENGSQPLAVKLVAADTATAVRAAAQMKSSAKDAIYRAVFQDHVKLTQGQATLATAAQMQIDFADRSGAVESSAKTPSKVRPNRKAKQVAVQPEPAQGGPQGGTDPLGIKADQPVVIRWAGPLTVTPAPEEPLKPEGANDAIVRFASSADEPVLMYAEGGQIEASWVAYQVQKQFAWIDGAEGKPVRMTDAKGSLLVTPQLRYAQRDGVATLRGPSSATVISDAAGEAQMLNATWKDSAEAKFGGQKSKAISQLTLKGDVKVQHPRLKQFDAGALQVDFAEPTAAGDGKKAGQIRQITASDSVQCVIADEKGKSQNIRAGNLKLMMANDAAGKSYPAKIEASGSVVAGDGVEQIQADLIQADLDAPGPKPATGQARPQLAGLQQLIATGHVQLDSAKGQKVRGDHLLVRQGKERSNWIQLEGKPASVVQGPNTLEGSFIEVDTATEKAIVTGGGRMIAVDEKLSGGKPRPVEVVWAGAGTLDGKTNHATLSDNVLVTYVDADGTTNEAAGDRVEIDLAQRPVAADANAAKSDKKEFSFMAGRYAKHLTLLPAAGKEIRLQSVLPDANGIILRQLNLLGPRLDCALSADGVQRIEVPGSVEKPGRFLYIALPPATRKPLVGTPDPLKARSISGSTAFAWRDKLIFDKATGQITMSGGVMVRHEPQLPGAKAFQVDADSIVAELANGNKDAAKPIEALEVRRLILRGNPVHLVRDDIDLTSPLVEIEPASGMVHAAGSTTSLVQVDKGRMLGSFEAVSFNTQSSEMVFSRGNATGRK